jgi:hypothetical protein
LDKCFCYSGDVCGWVGVEVVVLVWGSELEGLVGTVMVGTAYRDGHFDKKAVDQFRPPAKITL